ncbi:hypothetical protein PWG71_17520 [Nocardiopsis sp. N85]|uniref:hypothetical protein n=1 Tax=Nocardiopsis sp. N85 TaxID=3029400 RepID=UPI00237F22AC|nr:hypothetical protein [Nocardiopsis sp. N85]MDE3723195.1 hypothetical protein [Nocardiopsis sp. N85]
MSRASRPGHPRPTAVIAIAPDERSAEILIEGQRQVVTGSVPKETRRAALDVATGYAARIGQPVLIDARDSNGYWNLVATPDGVVQAADRLPASPAPAAPRPPTATGPERGKRRGPVIAGAVVLALVLLGGAGVATWRMIPGTEPAPRPTAVEAQVLGHPAPPGYADNVEFSEELATAGQPGVSRDGELMAFMGPDERLNLFDASGTRLWSAALPAASAEFLGPPRFVEYDGEEAVVMETTGTLWFWPVAGGAHTSLSLPEDASTQYVGFSALVRSGDDALVPVGDELVPVDVPDGSAPMLAEGTDVLMAVRTGPWTWTDPDGEVTEVTARRPEDAGEMDSVVTALREYVIIRWNPLRGDGAILAFHDSRDGSVIGTAEIDPADLEGVRHRSGPIGTEVVSYGPVVMDPESGATAVVPGFEPQIAVGTDVFGQLDGASVAVDATGEVQESDPASTQPVGLLGGNAIVVHEDHLYAIPSR